MKTRLFGGAERLFMTWANLLSGNATVAEDEFSSLHVIVKIEVKIGTLGILK